MKSLSTKHGPFLYNAYVSKYRTIKAKVSENSKLM